MVDDEAGIRKLFKKHFESKGYQVTEAADGKEALARYRANPPDLLVTDIVMPEKEGIGLIMDLRKEFPDLKFIAISGGGLNASDAYLEIAKNLGALRTFEKPIDWAELAETIDDAFAQHASP
jgi:CheY-like chemotaxis protein